MVPLTSDPQRRDFTIVYLPVDPEEDGTNMSGITTLAYLNLLGLRLTVEEYAEKPPDYYKLPKELDLRNWLKQLLSSKNEKAIGEVMIFAGKPEHDPRKVQVHLSCICRRYLTAGTPEGDTAITCECDSCGESIHRSCLYVPDPGLRPSRYTEKFLKTPSGTTRVNTDVVLLTHSDYFNFSC